MLSPRPLPPHSCTNAAARSSCLPTSTTATSWWPPPSRWLRAWRVRLFAAPAAAALLAIALMWQLAGGSRGPGLPAGRPACPRPLTACRRSCRGGQGRGRRRLPVLHRGAGGRARRRAAHAGGCAGGRAEHSTAQQSRGGRRAAAAGPRLRLARVRVRRRRRARLSSPSPRTDACAPASLCTPASPAELGARGHGGGRPEPDPSGGARRRHDARPPLGPQVRRAGWLAAMAGWRPGGDGWLAALAVCLSPAPANPPPLVLLFLLLPALQRPRRALPADHPAQQLCERRDGGPAGARLPQPRGHGAAVAHPPRRAGAGHTPGPPGL